MDYKKIIIIIIFKEPKVTKFKFHQIIIMIVIMMLSTCRNLKNQIIQIK